VAGSPLGRGAGSLGAGLGCCHGGHELHREAEAGSGGEEASGQPAADSPGVSARCARSLGSGDREPSADVSWGSRFEAQDRGSANRASRLCPQCSSLPGARPSEPEAAWHAAVPVSVSMGKICKVLPGLVWASPRFLLAVLPPSRCEKPSSDSPPWQCGQQVEGGDPAPLLLSGESSSGVLCPALEPLAQEGHGPAGAGPEEGHKNDQRAGTPLL